MPHKLITDDQLFEVVPSEFFPCDESWKSVAKINIDETTYIVKLLKCNATDDQINQFEADFEHGTKIKHPNVVSPLQRLESLGDRSKAFKSGGSEFCDGFLLPYFSLGSLQSCFSQIRELQFEQKTKLVEQLVNGLQAIHEEGIIHGDLKPSNVFLSERLEPKIGDFDSSISESNVELTRPPKVVGTDTHKSPEARASKDLDLSHDVYSMGLIIHEILSGELRTISDVEVNVSESHDLEICDDIPEIWRKLIEHCVQNHSFRRIQNGGQLAAYVKRLNSGKSSFVSKNFDNRKVLSLLATAVLLLTIGWTIQSLFFANESHQTFQNVRDAESVDDYQIGLKYLSEDKVREALQYFDTLKRSHPVHFHVGVGNAKLAVNDAAGAINHLERAVELGGIKTLPFKARSSLCAAYVRASRPIEAASCADELLKLEPTSMKDYRHRLYVLTLLDRRVEAIEETISGINLSEGHGEYLELRAQQVGWTNRYFEAERKRLKKSGRPMNATQLHALGLPLCYFDGWNCIQKGRFEDAQWHFSHLRKSHTAFYLVGMASVERRQGNSDLARVLLYRAGLLDLPQALKWDFYIANSEVMSSLDRFQEARDFAKKVLDLDARSARDYYYRVQAQVALGENDLALKEAKTGLKCDATWRQKFEKLCVGYGLQMDIVDADQTK